MVDDSAEDEELLKRVGVRRGISKPISLWVAQVVFGLYAAMFFNSGVQGFSADVLDGLLGFAFAGGLAALIVAIQRRRRWAYWVSSVLLFGVCLMGAAKQYAGGANGPLEISSAERSGAALGGWSLVLSLGVLAVRVAFGSPSREFFDSPPGRDVPVDV